MFDVEGKIKALTALKDYEKTQLEYKIDALISKKSKLKKTLDDLKPRVTENLASTRDLQRYRTTKLKLHGTSNKLNKLQNKLKNLIHDIENGKLKLCFGTKSLYDKQYRLEENGFKTHIAWYNRFIKNRDKNISYLGSSDETQGNQLFQLTFNETNEDFNVKVRKENNYVSDSKYIKTCCDFKYQKEHLKTMLKGGYPLTYRIKRVNNKWYLQVIITIKTNPLACKTESKEGVIGLDYNEGFIELCETNKQGNIVRLEHIDMHYKGLNNKAKSEIREVVSKICGKAIATKKDIVIEDLNFNKTKGKTITATSKSGKKYNRMISQLDYSRYKETFENTCFRLNIGLKKVNPYNTSKIGKQKYAYLLKLNTHQAASYVIARRGQGFKDELKSEKVSKKISN
jgi:IS605 OrfB family transposase